MEYWEELFRLHILQRGLNYYKKGAVISLNKTESGYHAEVEGTEDYEVDIEIKDGEIGDMYCSCPYADDGNYCKHMAAVLYAIDEDEASESGELEAVDLRKDRLDSLRKMVEGIPEHELRELVVSLAEEDSSLRDRLLMQYGTIGPKLLLRVKNQVDEIGWRYSSGSGYIDYRDAYDYCMRLKAVLYDNIPVLTQRGCLKEAFELTNYVFMEIADKELDDSDGSTTEVASLCYEYWKQILSASDETEEKEMIDWFKRRNRDVRDYMRGYIQEFLLNEFHDEELLWENLKYLDESIKKLESSTEKDRWSRDYEYTNCVFSRLSIMAKLGYSENDIREYRDRYRRLPDIRKMEIQEYKEKREYDAAISVLKESKTIDSASPGLVFDYSADLIELYHVTGQKAAYKAELAWMVCSCSQHDLTYVLKLKDVCTAAEWVGYRDKILNSDKAWSIQYKLLEHEELYGQLLEAVRNQPGVYVLNQYETVLKKHFPNEVMNIYADYVQSRAERTSDRTVYKELAQYLKKIAEYPDGRSLADRIAGEWKKKYRRRSAMMDELKRAGF